MSYILLRDGSRVEIADIATFDEGVDALAALDESIIAIEEQLERAEVAGDTSSDWVIRTRTALKHRRRSRPPLQEHVGKLRRAAKLAAQTPALTENASRKAAWHTAFVNAVRDHVTGEQFRVFSEQADATADAATGGAS